MLEEGLGSESTQERQGVCIGLSEIIQQTSRDNVLLYMDSLLPTVRNALCDRELEVRAAAAMTFDSLHTTIGKFCKASFDRLSFLFFPPSFPPSLLPFFLLPAFSISTLSLPLSLLLFSLSPSPSLTPSPSSLPSSPSPSSPSPSSPSLPFPSLPLPPSSLPPPGPRVLDEVLSPLLSSLSSSSSEHSEVALDGLRQVMAVKSRVVLPHIVPQLIKPPVNIRALALLTSVAGM